MNYSAALPLFLIWRENFDGFHCFHGFFLSHAQEVKGRDLKNQNKKFCLTSLKNNLFNFQ